MRIGRLDRLASVYFSHPLKLLFARTVTRGIPVLMYHAVEEGTSGKHPYYDTRTSPAVFAAQMKYLKQHSYRFLSVEEAADTLRAGDSPDRSVAITFDDGYRTFYTEAYPILAELGLVATVFLISGCIGKEGFRRNGKEYMTWEHAREVQRGGIHIGSHTVSHPQLKTLNMARIHDEISASKRALEDGVGAPVVTFSYPFAFPETDRPFTRWLRNLLVAYGYRAGVSTILGTASQSDDPFFLPRLPVNSWDDAALFRAKLEGGYDWLHPLQYASKLVKAGLL